MAGSRLQAPYRPQNQENPYLKPLPPQVNIYSGPGRFQQASLLTNSAEERTRVPLQTVKETKTVKTETGGVDGDKVTETKTTVVD